MAFLSNFRFLEKIGVPKISTDLCYDGWKPARFMSTAKIFVGGIPQEMNDQCLKESFAKYGQVVKAWIPFNREGGIARKFGFVVFTSEEAALAAVSGQNGKELQGKKVFVDLAFERARYQDQRGRSYRNSGHYYGGYDAGVGYGGYAGGFFGQSRPTCSTSESSESNASYGGNYGSSEVCRRYDDQTAFDGRPRNYIGNNAGFDGYSSAHDRVQQTRC